MSGDWCLWLVVLGIAVAATTRPLPSWPYDGNNHFPAMWFGGGSVERYENATELAAITRYQVVVFGYGVNMLNATNRFKHAEQSVHEQCGAVKARNTNVKCFAYLQTQSAFPIYDTLRDVMSDNTTRYWWLTDNNGAVWNQSSSDGLWSLWWDWRNTSATDHFVNTVVPAVVSSKFIDGVFLDDWDGAATCTPTEGTLPTHYTAQDRKDMRSAKVAAMRRTAHQSQHYGAFPIFATAVQFNHSGTCAYTENDLLVALGPTVGFMRFRVWPYIKHLTPGRCQNTVDQALQERHLGVPQFFYVVLAQRESVPVVSLAAFLIIRDVYDYFGASTGWSDSDWHWQHWYSTQYGAPSGPASEVQPGVYVRHYNTSTVRLDCTSVTATITPHSNSSN